MRDPKLAHILVMTLRTISEAAKKLFGTLP